MPIDFDKIRKTKAILKDREQKPPTIYNFGRVGGYLNIRAGTYGYAGIPLVRYSLEGFNSDILRKSTLGKMTESRFSKYPPHTSQILKVHDSKDIFTSRPLQIAELSASMDAAPMFAEIYVALEFCEHAVGLSLVKVGNNLTIVYSDLSGFDYGVGRQVNAGVTGRVTQAVEFLQHLFLVQIMNAIGD